MAIKAPGKRLGASIKFKRIKSGLSARGGKSLIINLNLTPMIDMFVILVVFLLMVFSATGEILFVQKDIIIPKAYNTKPLDRAPIIGISKDSVLYEGEYIMNTAAINEKVYPDWRVTPIADKLKRSYEAFVKVKNPKEFTRDIIIQAHKGVQFNVIKMVMLTCAMENYSSINFAVIPGGRAGKLEGVEPAKK